MTKDKITIEMQAGAVRHMIALAPPNLAPAVEAATKTLDYHARHKSTMRACAYFAQRRPELMAFFDEMPGAEITAVGEHGELSGHDD